jgi:MOSC domain-containing protein YiiM
VTKPCDPCRILFSLPYVGTKRGPEFLRTMLGRRGWFAKVLQGGTVRAGAPVEVIRF